MLADLPEDREVAGDNGNPERERFDQRQSEAFRMRWKQQGARIGKVFRDLAI